MKARFIRNRRLSDAANQWAMCSLRASPACREFYDRRRTADDLHHQALRALGNRLVGYLHGCLRNCTLYDEAIEDESQTTTSNGCRTRARLRAAA